MGLSGGVGLGGSVSSLSSAVSGSEDHRRVAHIKLDSSKMVEETYQLGRKLGEGTFGVVYEARLRATGELWAVKKLSKERGSATSSKSWEREIHILRNVTHPNIIQVREILESDQHAYLVLELCSGGNLAHYLRHKRRLSEDEARHLMTQLTSAVAYLHRKSIVHRDIKLDNLLLSTTAGVDEVERLQLKLSDFGLSVELRKMEDTMLEFCGTPLYMAPEICAGKSYSRQCDVWSMGIILHVLLTGRTLFRASREEPLYAEVRHYTVAQLKPGPGLSPRARHCLERLLHEDPGHRYSAAELLLDPWISGVEMQGNQITNVLQLMKDFHSSSQAKNSRSEDSALVDVGLGEPVLTQNSGPSTPASRMNSRKRLPAKKTINGVVAGAPARLASQDLGGRKNRSTPSNIGGKSTR